MKNIEVDPQLQASKVFQNGGIDINITGDIGEWTTTGQPALMIGNHNRGMEHFGVSAVMGELGRTDFVQVTNPSPPNMQIADILFHGREHTISVMPRTFARDTRGLGDSIYAAVHNLPDLNQAEVDELNEAAIQEASDLFVDGYAVNIYPAASRPMTEKWEKGIGRIVAKINEGLRREVLIVPFKVENFDWKKLFGTLLLSRLKVPASGKFNFFAAHPKTLFDLTGGIDDPRLITERLKEFYLDEL